VSISKLLRVVLNLLLPLDEWWKENSVNCWDILERREMDLNQIRKDNQQPSLGGNSFEGSTTGGSLTSLKEYGDNTRLERVTFQDMPNTCNTTGDDTV
jgi:hypothetical protein